MTSSRSGLPLIAIAFAAAFTTVMIDHAVAQRLNRNEAKGTHLSGRWRAAPGLVTHGPDGKVIFLYGEIQPSIVCSPLQVCDIELQPGEVVRVKTNGIETDGLLVLGRRQHHGRDTAKAARRELLAATIALDLGPVDLVALV